MSMEYSPIVLPILRAQREFLMASWGHADIVDQKDDSAVNIVTAVDIEMEERTAAALAIPFPDVPLVGEERGGRRDGMFWLMDPIDGTQHYVRGLPFCTSMLALIQNGQVMFSAIYDFLNDHMYSAERGKGAFCNDKRLSVSDRSLKEGYISWETHLDKSENMEAFNALRHRSHFVKLLCAGWEFAMVASGKMDARLSFDPFGKDYDFAPGSLLVQEAGGVVANIGSRDYDYRNTNFIAANPVIFKELTEGADAIFPIAG